MNRVSWIDVCRGIGILLVLYGHVLGAHSYRYVIYSFHMPLFFFLSGMVFNPQKYPHFLPYVKKTAKDILIPYFLFALLTYIAAVLISPNRTLTVSAFIKEFLGVVYGNGANGGIGYNVALWFLPCLFITRLAFWGMNKYVPNKLWMSVLVGCIALFGYLFSVSYPNLKLFFGIETALTAVVFYALGSIWIRTPKLSEFIQKRTVIVFVTTLVVMIVLSTISFREAGFQVDMRMNRLHNFVLFYSASIAGIIAAIALSMKIRSNMILEYIGKHSLILFVWHTLIYSYFNVFVSKLNLSHYFEILLPAIYTSLAVELILICDVLIERLFARVKVPSRA